jgi:hypothetical protein
LPRRLLSHMYPQCSGPTSHTLQKESGGTLCMIILSDLSSSPRKSLLDLMRVADKQLPVFYIRLLHRCERHPDVERLKDSQYTLTGFSDQIEEWGESLQNRPKTHHPAKSPDYCTRYGRGAIEAAEDAMN